MKLNAQFRAGQDNAPEMRSSSASVGSGSAMRQPPAGAVARLLRFLGSPEFLLFSYLVGVLLEFKPLLYLAVLFLLVHMPWRITWGRAAVYGVLVAATLAFFTTRERIGITLNTLVLLLGIFCAPQFRHRPRAEYRLAVWCSLALILYCLLYTSKFEFTDGVVSHNFIPIIGLYMLMLCATWRRGEILFFCFLLSAVVLAIGSRSGAAVFLLLGLYFLDARVAIVVALTSVALLVVGFDTDVLPAQFQRNYESGIDPRLFIWDEFLSGVADGNIFRREDFGFMVTFDLDRNFHNSVLEAYYRVGPFVVILLFLHLRLMWCVRYDNVLFAVFSALLAKALFDTYLWFTPIDLLIFMEYGSRLFDRCAIESGR